MLVAKRSVVIGGVVVEEVDLAIERTRGRIRLLVGEQAARAVGLAERRWERWMRRSCSRTSPSRASPAPDVRWLPSLGQRLHQGYQRTGDLRPIQVTEQMLRSVKSSAGNPVDSHSYPRPVRWHGPSAGMNFVQMTQAASIPQKRGMRSQSP